MDKITLNTVYGSDSIMCSQACVQIASIFSAFLPASLFCLAFLLIVLVIIRHFVLKALIIICTFFHRKVQFVKKKTGKKKKRLCIVT